MNEIINHEIIEIALKIAKRENIIIPQKFIGRALYNKDIADSRIKYWKRKGKATYCGQYTSDVFIRCGFNMEPILIGRSLWDINTTMQYENAIKSVEKGNLKEITAEQSYYLACIGIPSLILSPKHMIIDDKPYNHAAITIYSTKNKYDKNKGPVINQQGWYSLKRENVSHKYAWGKNWINEMVKYFLPELT